MVDSEFGELNSDYLGKWKWDFPSELIYLLWTHLSALNSFIWNSYVKSEGANVIPQSKNWRRGYTPSQLVIGVILKGSET